jgi:tungstate transport system substrate-binding protein
MTGGLPGIETTVAALRDGSSREDCTSSSTTRMERRVKQKRTLPVFGALVCCIALLCVALLTPAVAMAASPGIRSVKMATTTSTDNSGLLAALLPPFTEKYGVDVRVIAVGTGRAIKHGENGDVDLIMVHARQAEDQFVAAAYGVNRRDVMHNDFVLIGPDADPAGVRGLTDATAALAEIAAERSFFVSRGDESGTHKKEMQLWRETGSEPAGDWYLSVGRSMGAVLTMADEKRAYTLTDRGTYLAFADKLEMEILVGGDPRLHNPYGVIAVDPARHSHVNYVDAMALIGWLTSPEGQNIIGQFRKGGESLFHPDAIPR